MKDFFKNLFKKRPLASSSEDTLPNVKPRSRMRRMSTALRRKLPRKWNEVDIRKVNLESVSKNSSRIQWALILLAVFLSSAIASRVVSLFIRPTYIPIPTKRTAFVKPPPPPEEYNVIEDRNIFDVENKIPENFDPGFLDCFAQARPTTQQLTLHGTIVMGDDKLSVALVQEEGNPQKLGVRKDETFFDKYQMMKIDRKKICFQVKQTQEIESLEIPEEGIQLGVSGPTFTGRTTEGITPKTETSFEVKSSFLDAQLNNLNDILQTAKAVPYMDGGKMKGFLIQSIEQDSVFASLGIRQGDVLTSVNDINLDNIGKGVEAFQRLRKATKIELKVMRGGQAVPLTFEVK